MSSTYIIGDVHGNYNGLVESLQKMGWKENEDRLIFVGDLVDRGIANKKVIDFVAEHKDTVHIVLGNHELQHKKMVQYYRILAKNPTVRKLAAGIFLRFAERESVSSGRAMKSTLCVVI
jgi:predicted phosphodiesterase